MRTKDIEKLGIDRNFLRACYKYHKILKPKRIPCRDTFNEDYYPCEYTQEDVEIIWNTYLCRKMGLSFDEIKELNQGRKVKIRESLALMIQKKEEEIAELQAIVEFAKYIKGLGIDFIPAMPEKPLGSKSFADYLRDYINYIDKDKKLKEFLNMTEIFASENDLKNISIDKFTDLETYCKENISAYNSECANKLGAELYKLKEMLKLKPNSQEVQGVIQELYNFQKMIEGKNLTAWDFGSGYYFLLSESSDLSKTYENMLGKEAFELLKNSLLEFLTIECPERIKKICN